MVALSLRFVFLAAVLSVFSEMLRGFGLVAEFVGSALVPPAAWLISFLQMEPHIYAAGPYLVVPGAKLAILRGCEALDAVTLLICAVVLSPMPGWHKLLGVLGGALILHAVNVMRVTLLFYLWRTDANLFSLFHGYVAPIILIACAGLVFYGCLRFSRHRPGLSSENS